LIDSYLDEGLSGFTGQNLNDGTAQKMVDVVAIAEQALVVGGCDPIP
jgi:hypothetical protein